MHRGILAIEAGYETVGDVFSRRSRGGQLLVVTHDRNEAGIHTPTEEVFWNLIINDVAVKISGYLARGILGTGHEVYPTGGYFVWPFNAPSMPFLQDWGGCHLLAAKRQHNAGGCPSLYNECLRAFTAKPKILAGYGPHRKCAGV
jgi:hypothetical protein